MQIENIKKLLIKLDDSIFQDFPVNGKFLVHGFMCVHLRMCVRTDNIYIEFYNGIVNN